MESWKPLFSGGNIPTQRHPSLIVYGSKRKNVFRPALCFITVLKKARFLSVMRGCHSQPQVDVPDLPLVALQPDGRSMGKALVNHYFTLGLFINKNIVLTKVLPLTFYPVRLIISIIVVSGSEWSENSLKNQDKILKINLIWDSKKGDLQNVDHSDPD